MIKNIAFYHFFSPDFNLEAAKTALRHRMLELGIKGSILLAQEGINCSLAGSAKEMDSFMLFLLDTIHIQNPVLKISRTQDIPFKRSLVKVKDEVVASPGATPIDPAKDSAPRLSPEEFSRWIEEGKEMIVLDTRNDYEYDAGRFIDAKHLGTKHFANFEEDLKKAPSQWKTTPIVTFCTGGIRCEKAAPLMLKKGFREVYQLDGGILNYFQKLGKKHYEGDCFVFDQRVALNEELKPLNTSYKKLGE